tara:strand:- start:171 stop:485 length:315 start_codon:yes stop_codon:yes gene_type:complete
MDKILNKISDIIESYESGAWVTSENLRIMLRELSTNKYYLTKYNIEAYQKYNSIVYKCKKSVAYGKTLADEQVPELRMTRKILEACKDVIMSMQQELSIIKNDK